MVIITHERKDCQKRPGVSTATTYPQAISRLFFGDQQALNFAVMPVAPNGTGTGEVSVDHADVVVKYRLP
ncbi:MAG: hypothetical protein HY897_19935 [Deltaproteobacteria bacterium]|nr:hypothetical protein [Deltaproteobacteria bacterium]